MRIISAHYGEGVIVSFSGTHITQLMYELVCEYDGRYLTGAPLQVFFPSTEKFREFETAWNRLRTPIREIRPSKWKKILNYIRGRLCAIWTRRDGLMP